MQQLEKVEFFVDKTKLKKFLLLGLIFCLVSVWMIFWASPTDRSPLWFIKTMGIVGLLFFGFGSIVLIKQYLNKEAELTLDTRGLTMSPARRQNTRFIAWNSITGFGEGSNRRGQFILIFVDNVEDLIEKEKNILTKKAMQMMNNAQSTPFIISSTRLNIGHTELLNLLNQYKKEYSNQGSVVL